MRGSLRPVRPDLRPEVRFRPAPAVDPLPVSRDACPVRAGIGAAVSLAKGDKKSSIEVRNVPRMPSVRQACDDG